MKKQFLILFAFISVLALGQVPQRFNKVIVTGDIASPKFIKTGSNADSVLLGNGSARAISTVKTDTVSLSNRINAKAAGSGTANGTNTGDETLTTIKTKLGAATSVSDGYLKYQDFVNFDGKQPKLNGSGFVKSFSGEITYDANNYELAFSKNTAFNKNFGTTAGTVLEGRTFGTAANSAVGDFQPIENQRLSTTNSPTFNTTTATRFNLTGTSDLFFSNSSNNWSIKVAESENKLNFIDNQFRISMLSLSPSAATFASAVNSTGFLLNGNNLTSSLTTNYIPKWNGSNFVNATAGTDYQLPITLTTNGTSGAATFSGNVLNVPNYGSSVVYQTQTTVNGSTSGSMLCSMPFQTGSYKKVIIYLTNLVGTAEYIFPVQFVGGASKRIITTNVTVGTSGSFPDDRINITATSGNGTITIEGY